MAENPTKQRTAHTGADGASRASDPAPRRRATSPLVPPGAIAVQAPESTDDRSLRRELLLGDLARRTLNDLEPRRLARVAVETIGRGLEVDICLLLAMRGNRLVSRESGVYAAPAAALDVEFAIDGANEIFNSIRLEGEVVVDDVEREVEAGTSLASLGAALSAKSLLAVPIIFSSRMRALLVLAMQTGRRAWTMDERHIAREASSIISVAQRQGELLDEARRVGERELLIRQIGRALRSSLGLDHVLRTAAERVGEAVKADGLVVWRSERTTELTPLWRFALGSGEQRLVERAGAESAPVSISERVLEELLARHSAQLVDDDWIGADALLATLPPSERRVIVCPIVVRGEIWGLVEIDRRSAGWVWREGELAFVSEVAEQLATAVAQAQLFDQVLRSQHEWETTFDGLADAVIIYDDQRSVRRTNLATSTLLNRPLGDLIGNGCCSLGLCTDKDGCAVERAMGQRERVVLEILSQRTYHVLHVTVDPIVNERGNIIGAVQLVRDLDDLRRTEAELRRQQHFLVNLVESAHDAIFVIDLAGRLVWSNSHLAGLSGRLISEMLGQSYTSFVSEDQHEEFDQHFRAAMSGESRRFEASIYNTTNGEERRVVLTYSPIHEDGKVVSVLGVARDVTEEKSIAERSQQADKLRALGQLASGVAHDVNNDLAAILGRVQRLMRNPEYQALNREFEVIETAALDSAQTVRRIQNFARQQGQADFVAVDLNGLVRDAIEITRTRWLDDAQSRGIRYTVDFEAANLPPILGDGSQLREVFVNLIINAIDAMPEGGALRVVSSDGDGEAVVRFADEGMGIPRRIRERIFEPFFSTKGASGTGMGLAVSYGIVTRHNGRIDLESEVGKGTTFTLSFPLTDLPAEVSPVRAAGFVGPLKVLVIDDEEVVREVLADLLDEQGHTVFQTATGAEGISIIERNGPFDVVFTDLSMPEMDGWAVARCVRERFEGLKVVLVTGYGVSVMPPNEETGLVDSIIGKPFEYDDISDLLWRLYLP